MSRISSVGCISLSPSVDSENVNVTEFDEDLKLEDSSKGKVKGSLLMSYLTAGDNWPLVCILIFLFVFVQALANSADYGVSFW